MTETTTSATLLSGVPVLYSSANNWSPVQGTLQPSWRYNKFRSFKPYVRRVRPVVPALSPTEQLTGSQTYDQGRIAFRTRVYPWSAGGYRYYEGKDLYWVPQTGPWTPSMFSGIVARLSGAYWIPVISIDAENLAQNDCLSKLNDAQISGPVTAAEAVESARWMSQRGEDVVSISKAIRHRDWKAFRDSVNQAALQRPPNWVNIGPKHGIPFKGVKQLPKHPSSNTWKATGVASERWLEYRYAVVPLLYEAEYYARWLAGMWEDYKSLTEITGEHWRKYEGEFKVRCAFWPASSGGSPGTAPSGVCYWKGRIVDKRTALYRVVDSQKRMYASLGGTYGDMSLAAWELVPWSFVADWGISFGDYLDLMSADIGLEYVTGWKNSNLKARVVESDCNKGDAVLWTADAPFSALRMNYRLPASAPRPNVVVRSRFGINQMFDSISLLRTIRKFT